MSVFLKQVSKDIKENKTTTTIKETKAHGERMEKVQPDEFCWCNNGEWL